MLSPELTPIDVNTLWSHITGRSVNASVVPGVLPAPSVVLEYQAGMVSTDVLLLRIIPHDAVVPGNTTWNCSPARLALDAVYGVPVTVADVAVVAVNGVPVVADSVPLVCSPHSVTDSVPA